jgi:hypothetical protein
MKFTLRTLKTLQMTKLVKESHYPAEVDEDEGIKLFLFLQVALLFRSFC